jgi:hypothetical protein
MKNYKWQDKCYQFLIGKGFDRKQAQHHLFNFVRDNMHEDFHFDVDTRVNEADLTKVLMLLTKYYNAELYIYEYAHIGA